MHGMQRRTRYLDTPPPVDRVPRPPFHGPHPFTAFCTRRLEVMQVTLSRVSPVEVEMKVSLPKERVSTALARAYTTLGKNAQIRGFRRGKVPLALLKQYFGERVAAEVTDELVGESLPKAIEE